MKAKSREEVHAEAISDSLQDGRKRLPIFTYRDELLEAIRDNQVLQKASKSNRALNEDGVWATYSCLFNFII